MKRILSFFLLSFAFINAMAQIPAGYYDPANGLTGAALKSKLNQIISANHVPKTYNQLYTGYPQTDSDNFYENDGTVLDIYSENPNGPDPYVFTHSSANQCGNYSKEGDCYNREHIVPQSLFGSSMPMVSDIHFIRPTDGKVNGMRSNNPFGKVGTASFTSKNGSKLGNSISPGFTGTVFEPIDAFKGDVARMILYFVTRYETQLSGFTSGNMLGNTAYPGLQDWELKQLLEWHIQDPVSPEEVSRNNASYIYQGNRNPYIDHPEYVVQIWGTPVIDTVPPTAPTNLTATNPTSNTVSLNWTAATDNIGVTSYNIYANGALKTSVSGTTLSTTVTGLAPLTAYTFYVIAKDAAGNSSPQSNDAAATTLDGPVGGSCGTEDFETIPGGGSSYLQSTSWTNNGITWTATDARTDQTINGKAITIRDGALTSSTLSGGIQNLTIKTQLKFTGSAGNLNVYINNVNMGTIPYSSTQGTFTLNNINVAGNVTIRIVNPVSSNRVALDDLSWTCLGSLGTTDIKKDKSEFTIYPNPVKNNELFVKGENLGKISKAEIYDLSGKLIETIVNPFKNSNKINLRGLVKGNYILKTDNFSTKFIVE